ncbi:MAG: hypothetical protein ABFR36_06470 [Acidobacteriota bacterium]
MGRKKCELTDEFSEQLKTGHLSDKMKDHMEQCNDCSNEYVTDSWIKNYSVTEISGTAPEVPPFNSLWSQAFKGKKIETDLIEKAMFPMKIAGLFAKIIVILSIIVFVVLNNTVVSGVGSQLDSINQLGRSFIAPFMQMFNSSVFVSIPLTIIFFSILLYLVSSIVSSLNKRSFGSV